MDDPVSLLSLLVSRCSDVAVDSWVAFSGDLEGLAFAQSAKKDVNKTL